MMARLSWSAVVGVVSEAWWAVLPAILLAAFVVGVVVAMFDVVAVLALTRRLLMRAVALAVVNVGKCIRSAT